MSAHSLETRAANSINGRQRARTLDKESAPTLADVLAGKLTRFTVDELFEAREPWPHVWSDGERGLFPIGEVAIIAAPGREGKTYASISLASALATGLRVGGLDPIQARTTIILSAEDDRRQYARKVEAKVERLEQEKAELVRARIIVPDLLDGSFRGGNKLVEVIEREPTEGRFVAAIIEAVQQMDLSLDSGVGLLVFETASTLSEAEEDSSASLPGIDSRKRSRAGSRCSGSRR
ncbi:MAG: AAA family ATPase [Pseudoxanthomonas sp.]